MPLALNRNGYENAGGEKPKRDSSARDGPPLDFALGGQNDRALRWTAENESLTTLQKLH